MNLFVLEKEYYFTFTFETLTNQLRPISGLYFGKAKTLHLKGYFKF